MFNFFKRSDKASAGQLRKSGGSSSRPPKSRGFDVLEPLPLPQVHEGNLDSDWAMWEDSVLEQDSRPPAQYADTVPSHLDAEPDARMDGEPHHDPFAQVTKNAP